MKKTIFNILFIIISVLLLMCGCQIADKDTEEQMFYKVRISLGCAEIQSDGSPRWEAYPIDNWVDPKYDDTMLDLINDLKTFSTSDKPTDVELIEIRFKDQDSQDESTFYLAYDYYLKNTYLNRDGIWYKTNIPKKLNRLLLQTFNDSPNSFDSITWKVQSRYHAEVTM